MSAATEHKMADKEHKVDHRVEKASKPDERKHQEIVDKVDKRIQELRQEMDGVRRELDEKQGGRDEYNKARSEYRGQLDDLVVKINAFEAERKGIEAKVNESKVKSQEAKQGAQRLRKSLGYSTVQEIDERIAYLENEMMISSLSLKEEKKLMQDIAALKQSRPLLAKSNAAPSDSPQSLLPLKTQLHDITKQLDVLYEQKKAILGRRSKLIQERSATQQPVKELADSRISLAKELQEQERNRRVEFDRFRQEMRDYETRESQQRKKAQDRQREESKKIGMTKKLQDVQKQLDGVQDFPFDSEVTLLLQMKSYLKKLLDTDEEQKVEEVTQNGAQSHEDDKAKIEGALVPKKKREEFFYAPKEQKARKFQNKENKPHKAVKKPGVQKLVFDIDTLSIFKQFDIDTPTTTGDFPKCISSIDAKLGEFNIEKTKYEASIHDRRTDLNIQINDLTARLIKIGAETTIAEPRHEKQDPIAE